MLSKEFRESLHNVSPWGLHSFPSNNSSKRGMFENVAVVNDTQYYLPNFAYDVVAPIIICFGILSNGAILAVLRRYRLKGTVYTYLSSLALADMGVLMTSIPLVYRSSERRSRFGSYCLAVFFAHMELVINNAFMGYSIYLVVALTLERYISVCWPAKFKTMHNRSRTKLKVFIAYILALIICTPLGALKKVRPLTEEIELNNKTFRLYEYECVENFEITSSLFWRVYVWASETCLRFGPALILAVLNTCIIVKFRKVTQARKLLHSAPSWRRKLREERKLIVLLTCVIVLFWCAVVPSAALSLLYSEEYEKYYAFEVFRAIANTLELSNFASNFYIYFWCSSDFRLSFFEVFHWFARCRNRPQAIETNV